MEEKKTDKKTSWQNTLWDIILIIICSPLILLGFVIYFVLYIVPAPIELSFYKESAFYREFKIKYRIGISHGEDYKLYNAMKKRNLNFKLVICEKDSWSYIETKEFNLVFSWFTLIGFITQEEEWEICVDDIDNEEMLSTGLAEAVAKNMGDCDKPVKIIIQKNTFDKKDYERAKQEERFFIYKNKKDLINKLSNLQQSESYES